MPFALTRDRAVRAVWLALWIVYAILWIGGVSASQSAPWAAPLFLFLAAALALHHGAPRDLLLAAALGFLFEAVGVRFAYPFGSYEYTGVLAPKLLGVPVAIGCAWLLLFAYVRQLRMNLASSAICMTALDLVIDPLASNFLGFWRWLTPGPYFGVPLLNFAGWFATSLVLFAVTPHRSTRDVPTFFLGTSILLFFTVLAAVHGFFLPAALGALFACVGYWRFRSSNASTTI